MSISVVDPFDLPEWLALDSVTWRAAEPLNSGFCVEGGLSGADEKHQRLDLLAVDAAYPRPVCPDDQRRAAHQAWQFGEVALLDVDGRVAAGVPGIGFDANIACETLRRVAKSVGAESSNFTVSITL